MIGGQAEWERGGGNVKVREGAQPTGHAGSGEGPVSQR